MTFTGRERECRRRSTWRARPFEHRVRNKRGLGDDRGPAASGATHAHDSGVLVIAIFWSNRYGPEGFDGEGRGVHKRKALGKWRRESGNVQPTSNIRAEAKALGVGVFDNEMGALVGGVDAVVGVGEEKGGSGGNVRHATLGEGDGSAVEERRQVLSG
jgi:hypothetical protein